MTLHFVASAPQYFQHLQPIYEAMPDALRGGFWQKDGSEFQFGPSRDLSAFICNSYNDLMLIHDAAPDVPVIFMEHGAGHIFSDRFGPMSSYAGNWERPNVEMFLCTNDYVARANADAHPRARVEVVGCPKLDRWHNAPGRWETGIVAYAFHWDCVVSPGTRSALPMYKTALPQVAEQWKLMAHGHPRMEVANKMIAMEYGFRWADYDEVMSEADVLVSDVSSIMYEFASLDRPVVTCNIPEYRRMPDTGIRFWREIPGIQVDDPNDLVQAIETAFIDDPGLQDQRRTAVDGVYPIRGNATDTVVGYIKDFMGTTTSRPFIKLPGLRDVTR